MTTTWRTRIAAVLVVLAVVAVGPVTADDRIELPELVDAEPETVVDAAYAAVLGRAPTTAEAAGWAESLEVGSIEGLARTVALGRERARADVEDLYTGLLGRDGGDAVDFWVESIVDGVSVEAVIVELAASAEFRDEHGDDWIDALFDWAGVDPARDDADALDAMAADPDIAPASVVDAFLRLDDVVAARAEALRAPVEAVTTADDVDDAVLRDRGTGAFRVALLGPDFHESVTGEPPAHPTGRARATGFQPFATAAGLTLRHPAPAADVVGFHQAGNGTSLGMDVVVGGGSHVVMSSRGRGTGRTTAVDLSVPPNTEVRSPVTGVVEFAGPYALYCRRRDHRIAIRPDAADRYHVVVLHHDGLLVEVGDRVVAGVTPIAEKARVLPMRSQVERYAPSPAWPHLHIETLDPARKKPSTCRSWPERADADREAAGAIVRFYLGFFLRDADTRGHERWFCQVVNGRPLAAVAQDFADSDEFTDRYGRLGDRDFLDAVYENVFRRTPDDSGRRYWLGLLAAGTTRGDVMTSITASEEFRARTAHHAPPTTDGDLYRNLGRCDW